MPPQEKTGMASSVRPNRRYFIGAGYAMRSQRAQGSGFGIWCPLLGGTARRVRVERATGRLWRATRPPRLVRPGRNAWFGHRRADAPPRSALAERGARRQVAAENWPVARSTQTREKRRLKTKTKKRGRNGRALKTCSEGKIT
jgi:hypothetical protein